MSIIILKVYTFLVKYNPSIYLRNILTYGDILFLLILFQQSLAATFNIIISCLKIASIPRISYFSRLISIR